MSPQLLIVYLALFAQSSQSPFNHYTAFLEPRQLSPMCRLDEESFFRNLTYRFHGKGYPGEGSISFRNGQFDDRTDTGQIDWTISLERQEQIQLDNERAVMLSFFANHMLGSGSDSHVLVVRCRAEKSEVVFEASGEGVSAKYSNEWGLEITIPFWNPEDCHACGSDELQEQYRWNEPSQRFVLINKTKRQRP